MHIPNESDLETLGKIIPSDLKELTPSDGGNVIPVESRGTKCVGVLRQEACRFQVNKNIPSSQFMLLIAVQV